MLVFNLKAEWYNKIKSGKKRTEYRLYKDYWTKRVLKEMKANQDIKKGKIYPIPCRFVLGYSNCFMDGEITSIYTIPKAQSDLRYDLSDIDKVWAFDFKLKGE